MSRCMFSIFPRWQHAISKYFATSFTGQDTCDIYRGHRVHIPMSRCKNRIPSIRTDMLRSVHGIPSIRSNNIQISLPNTEYSKQQGSDQLIKRRVFEATRFRLLHRLHGIRTDMFRLVHRIPIIRNNRFKVNSPNIGYSKQQCSDQFTEFAY